MWAGQLHELVDPLIALTNRCTPQFDKVTADAAEFKAGFDKALLDNVEQKAQVGLAAWATRGLWFVLPIV